MAVVTGASSGIGLAIAQELAAAGASVVLGARRSGKLREAVDAIRAVGGSADAVTMDVTSEEDVHRLVQHAGDCFGRLDIMVCNAGFGYYGRVEDTDPAIMRRMMEVNFMGTFLGARAAVPVFRRQGHGHLIVVSSIVGRRGVGHMSGYSATKAAQVAFAESLRAEFQGTDIHVSTVLPVSTDTEFRTAMARDFGQRVSGAGPRQSARTVALAVVTCVRRPSPEVYPYGTSRLLTLVNAIAPALADRIVRRYRRTAG